jgi:hypothetical protein
MQSFESLIQASASGLSAILSPLRGRLRGEGDLRRGQLAQLLGVNLAQLVCSIGFNAELARLPDLPRFLGYPSRDAMLAERNYLFVHDRYRALSVNNVLEIYAALSRADGLSGAWSDLVLSRLGNLEGQLEETINPVLIGGYKLEVRAVYEHRLAGPGLVNTRLDPNYTVLREITGESGLMLETGALAPSVFLRHPGVSQDEKARAVFQELVPRADAEAYLAERPDADPDGRLRDALRNA